MTKRAFVLVALWFLTAAASNAASLDPNLVDEMNALPANGKLQALVYFKAQADIPYLNQQLDSEHATLAERNQKVILALQQVASETQPEMAVFLDNLKAQGAIRSYKMFWIANMFQVEASSAGIEAISSRPELEAIYLNYEIENIRPVDEEPSGNLLTGHEIGLDRVNAPWAWANGWTGLGRVVMNIDTGVEGTHPALSARFRGDVDGDGDVSESWFDPYDTHYPTPIDDGGHGTHTMGTICGRSAAGDTVGVAINAKWIAAAAIDRGGGIPRTVSDAIASFQWAVDPDGNPATQDNPDAIGNSWGVTTSHGYPPCDQTFWTVIDNCEAAGSAVIFSAGNEGPSANTLRRPADRGTTPFNCFAVGAVDGASPSLPIADFSSRGPSNCGPGGSQVIKPEVVAPGVNVRSSYPGGGYTTMSGTSMASPHVTGSVAILRQVNPNLSVDDIKSIFMQTATDLGSTGEDNDYGWGAINLQAAIQMASVGFGSVDGYVRNAVNNNPLPARVQIVGGGASVNANSSGYYILSAPAETTYTIRASYFGYIPLDHSVALIANDTVSQNFLLTPAPTAVLQGAVTSTGGDTINGAIVTILDTPLAPDTTDSHGFYRFSGVPIGSTYRVRVLAINYAQGLDSILVQSGTNVLNFHLYPAESFEFTNGGYTGSGEWEWGTPTYAQGPPSAHSGTKLWGTDLDNTYDNSVDYPLYSREYSIISPAAALEFYHWYATEATWDGGNVSLTTDGGTTWTLLTPESGYPDPHVYGLDNEPGYSGSSDWAVARFDIGSYVGQTVQFRWRFGSDVSIVAAGWYIDDVAVPGSGAPVPPNITYDPTSFSVSANPGAIETRNLNIHNTGAGWLNFTLSTQTFNTLRLDNGVMIPLRISNAAVAPIGYRPADPSKPGSKEEPIYPPVTTGRGGPDVFGYSWIDSDEPGGPTYNWKDITGFGTPITGLGDDTNVGPFTLGFNFSFYGNMFNSLRFCTNGFLSFTSTSTAYTNSAIPSTSAPFNLLAPLWDDLTFTSGGSAYFFTNNIDSAIVSYLSVPHYSTGGPYTFQIIILANGTIVYQYQAVNAPVNSATVGIQNSSGTDGLQVVYNATYLHNSLAVKFMRGWLFASPTSGHVAPGNSTTATITFDASNLGIGIFTGNINLDSNDPDTPIIDVPVTFNVGSGGTPNIVQSPASIRDTIADGGQAVTNLKVKNTGTGTLSVTLSDSATWITAPAARFYVAPGDSVLKPITLDAAGLAPGTYNSAVVTASNDPDTPTIRTPVTLFVPAPHISVSPTAIRDTLPPGGSAVHQLTIQNTGPGRLSYQVATNTNNLIIWNDGTVSPAKASPVMEPFTVYNRPESEPKTLGDAGGGNPPQILGHGGPDIFGYRWIDSDEPGGPTYAWRDISSIGQPISGLSDDTNVGPYALGFNFNFYGNTFNSIRFCTNGFLSFTSTLTTYTNTAIPSASAPFDLLAPFWDDLTFVTSGAAYFYTNNVDSAVVSYVNVPHYLSGGPYTFQVIILGGGVIVYQYQTINTPGNSATVGIQNSDGSDGLQVVFDAAYLHSSMAIRLSASWLSASPTSGNVNPSGQTQVAVSLDAGGLTGGIHTGNVVITSNDPLTPTVTVPVTLLVGGIPEPDIDIAISSISNTLPQGSQIVTDMVIRNYGTADLRVNLVATEFPAIANAGGQLPAPASLADGGSFPAKSSTNAKPSDSPALLNIWLFVNPAADTIPAGDSLIAHVTLNATSITPGAYSGRVSATSNDPDEPVVNVPVTLLVTGGGPPDIHLSVASFTETVITGNTRTESLYVSNQGTGDLHYGLHDNRAWITVTPDTGLAEPSRTDTIVVRFNASTLTPGTYTGQINVDSDDPDQPLIIIPVTLLVTSGGSGCQYVVGDVNGSGVFDGIDVGMAVNFFKGAELPPTAVRCPPCEDIGLNMLYPEGDANGTCNFDGIDIGYMVNHFKYWTGPGAPYPTLYCPQCAPVPAVAPSPGETPAVQPILKFKGEAIKGESQQ